MKKITYILLIQFFGFCVYSQKIGISFIEQNEFLVSQYIYFKIYSNSIPCDSIVVTSKVGIIEKNKDKGNCNYRIIAKEPGSGNIYFFKDSVLLDSFYVYFKKWPKSFVSVGGKSGGHISKDLLAAQKYVVAHLPVHLHINLVVDSYTVTVFEGDSVIFSETLKGNKISEQLKNAVKKCTINGYVIFSRIFLKGLGGVENADPIEFYIDK